MREFAIQILNYLLKNYALYLVVVMSVIISLTIVILTLIKKPVKKLTCKIKNEKLRHLANKPFIFVAFGLSALAWFVLNKISAFYFPFEAVNVFLTGALSIVVYALGDGIVTKSKAKELFDAVKEITEDKVIDEKDKTAVEEFYDKIKK